MNPGQPGPRSYPGTSGNGVRLEYLHVNARKEKHTCPRKKNVHVWFQRRELLRVRVYTHLSTGLKKVIRTD